MIETGLILHEVAKSRALEGPYLLGNLVGTPGFEPEEGSPKLPAKSNPSEKKSR
jgi:hypothetical protein